MTLPKEFKDRMTRLLGEGEACELFSAIEREDAVRAFRVNDIKTDICSFESADPEIERRAADFPRGAYLTEEKFPGSCPCHHSGAIYMQDISAMSTVSAVTLEEGMRVLDSCSAPGGKTTQLAAAVGERGIVVANEYDKKRCRILQGNVERMGAKNTVICNLDTAELAKTYPDVFDLVLCDAPCSGEGMFRKNELAVGEWSEENVKMCALRQREILGNAAKCVKAQGKLLYSTCTFSLEENEENVAWFLSEFPEFKLIKVNNELINQSCDGYLLKNCPADMTLCRRIYPHRSKGEGQFIALFERLGSTDKGSLADGEAWDRSKKRGNERNGKTKGGQTAGKNERESIAAAEAFLRENVSADALKRFDGELRMLGNIVFLSPRINLPEYNVIAAGVAVGEYQKGRILPHHQLFSAYGSDFRLKILLSGRSAEAKKYLSGEEIAVDGLCESEDGRKSGYAAVLIDRCSAGGAKVSNGAAKNHYPKGLRL